MMEILCSRISFASRRAVIHRPRALSPASCMPICVAPQRSRSATSRPPPETTTALPLAATTPTAVSTAARAGPLGPRSETICSTPRRSERVAQRSVLWISAAPGEFGNPGPVSMNSAQPLPDAAMILTRSDGSSTAYCRESGGNPPGIVFLPGLRSDMQGIKAMALAAHCRSQDHSFLRFDYFGHGASSGDFRAGTIGRWLEDALAVIDRLTEGPLLLVGSSMGGWIALLAALARPSRVRALIGIAPAADFTEDLIWDRLGAAERRELLERGEIAAPSAYEADPVPFTLRLVEEGRQHLLLRGPIRLSCPVRLLHGMEDPDVPYQTSLRLMERLTGTQALVELIEDGDHRLSRPQDLARLFAAVDAMAARFQG